SLARRGENALLTVNVEVAGDDTVADLLDGITSRIGELRPAAIVLLDPAPTGTYRVHSPMPPSHFEHAVSRAALRIRAGALEKVLLAREVDVHAPIEHEPSAVLG